MYLKISPKKGIANANKFYFFYNHNKATMQ